MVGQLLGKKLSSKGFLVRILTRTPKKENEFAWDISNNFIDEDVFSKSRLYHSSCRSRNC